MIDLFNGEKSSFADIKEEAEDKFQRFNQQKASKLNF